MSTKESRDVLDWFRTYSVGKLTAIGRTDITSNMNVPLNNDTRLSAALTYIDGVHADALAVAQANIADFEQYWAAAQDEVWAEIEATMPADVLATYDALRVDPDDNVRRLLKRLTVATSLLNQAHLATGGGG